MDTTINPVFDETINDMVIPVQQPVVPPITRDELMNQLNNAKIELDFLQTEVNNVQNSLAQYQSQIDANNAIIDDCTAKIQAIDDARTAYAIANPDSNIAKILNAQIQEGEATSDAASSNEPTDAAPATDTATN